MASFPTIGDDLILGTPLANKIDGLGGNDTIYGLSGADSLLGGSGDDHLFSSSQSSTDNSKDTLDGGAGDDGLFGSLGDEVLNGGDGNDYIYGDLGSDLISGGTGADTIYGGEYSNSPFDNVNFPFESNTIYCGDGNDRAIGGSSHDAIYGDAGDDYLLGSEYRYDVTSDFLSGGDGNDTIGDYGGDNVIRGGNGNDVITCIGNSSSSFTGNSDTIYGDLGADNIFAGIGDDLIYSIGSDTIDGSYDIDRVDFSLLGPRAGVSLNLSILGAQATGGAGMMTVVNVENLTGSPGNDRFVGDGASNLLNGTTGNDTLIGGLGNDTLWGGVGDDRLMGSAGKDILVGSVGRDTFVFITRAEPLNSDFINGFNTVDDMIQLAQAAFAQIGPVGALTANAFVIGTHAQDAFDRIVYDRAAGHLYYDPDGSGAAAALLFARTQINTAITLSDFMVI